MVEAGDILICLTDGTAAGNEAAVGTQWAAIQVNIDGALTTAQIGVLVQAYSAALSTIAGLTAADNDILQRKAGNWINRTLAQVRADLATYATIATDADAALTAGTSAEQIRHTGTLTAARAITLSGGAAGASFLITRTGGGAFNLNVGTGPLKALATNRWARFVHDGTAWYLASYGAL